MTRSECALSRVCWISNAFFIRASLRSSLSSRLAWSSLDPSTPSPSLPPALLLRSFSSHYPSFPKLYPPSLSPSPFSKNSSRIAHYATTTPSQLNPVHSSPQPTTNPPLVPATLLALINSGSPPDLLALKHQLDQILATPLHSFSSTQKPSVTSILNDDRIWRAYLQAVLLPSDKPSSISELTEAISQKNRARQSILDHLSPAATTFSTEQPQPPPTPTEQTRSPPTEQTQPASAQKPVSQSPLVRFLASLRLSPSSLVSAIFNRAGSKASVQNAQEFDLHAANREAIAASQGGASRPGVLDPQLFSSPKSPPGAGTAPDSVGTIRVVVEEFKGNLALRAIRFLAVTLVYSFIMLTLLSLVMDSSGLLKATSPTGGPTEFKPQGQKPVTFGDVHGCDEAKEELKEVVDFLKDPLRFARLGGRLPRGVLLTGPPGTGKTLLARAVAGEAGVQFFIASGSEFDEMYVGVGARRIRELFAAARKSAPAIIFIDELDAIGGKRSPKDQHYMKQTLNQLLVELDGFQQSEGVILMAATNFPASLDKALTRPGRFDRHVAVPLPDARGRVQILKHHSKNVTVDPVLDLSVVARSTPGFSGADLQNLVNQAAVKASREGAESVTGHHFDWARDRIMMGAENKSYITTPQQKRLTAYHEAGHALVSMYTPGATPLHKVTCLRRGHALGITHFLPEIDKVSESYQECLARLDVGMGGRAAEELLMGKENVTSGASSDIYNVTLVATAMIREMGFSTKLGPRAFRTDDQLAPETLAMIDGEVREMIEAAARRAMKLLLERRAELDRLASALVEFETLSAEEAWRVVKGECLERQTV